MNQKSIIIDRNVRCAYRQLSHILREQITGGEYLPGEQLPSVDELSRQTGLHPNTVKLAFRELRESGLVKYLPTVGCIVRDDAPCKIALILPEDYGQSLEVFAGLNEALGNYGRAELLPYKGAEEFDTLINVQTENYSGAAIYPEHSSAEKVRQLRESGFPLVQIDNFLRDVTQGAYVDSGLYEAGMLLTEHLIGQRHTPLAVIAPDNPGGWKFIEGYREAHRRKHETAWSCNIKKLNSQLGAVGLTGDLLSSAKPPQAIIYVNPTNALSGCEVLKGAGRDDVKIAGFGSLPGMKLWSIPVITAGRDYRKIGSDAGRILLELRQLPKRQRLTLRMEKHQAEIRI
ncbi:MAG: GntR family transcriptional regulator [Victivallaceae bacterium]